jgi:hypothetical protein
MSTKPLLKKEDDKQDKSSVYTIILIASIIAFVGGIVLLFLSPYITTVNSATITATNTPNVYTATYTIGSQSYTATIESTTPLTGLQKIYVSFLNKGSARLKSSLAGFISGCLLAALGLVVGSIIGLDMMYQSSSDSKK